MEESRVEEAMLTSNINKYEALDLRKILVAIRYCGEGTVRRKSNNRFCNWNGPDVFNGTGRRRLKRQRGSLFFSATAIQVVSILSMGQFLEEEASMAMTSVE